MTWRDDRERRLKYSREYYEANKAVLGEKERARARVVPRSVINARRKARRERLAGRPYADVCEVCACAPSGKYRILHFDHDHKTGEFRGWLCHGCNAVLGLVNDDTERLDKLIVYLMRSRRPRIVRSA